MGKTILSYFNGISCGMQAFKELGIEVDRYISAEINENAIKVSKDNHPEIEEIGDLTKIVLENLPKVDIFIGGSSCQDFSMAGKMEGMITEDNEQVVSLGRYLELKEKGFAFKGESYLFWEYVKTLKYLQSVNPDLKFVLENVKMSKKWEKVISDTLGVNPIKIDSSTHSSTNRKRLYWTNIPQDKNVFEQDEKLQDILTDGYTNREKGLCVLESCSRPLKNPVKIARRYFLYGFWTVVFKDEETYKVLKNDYNLAKEGDVRYLNQEELEKSLCLPKGYTNIVDRNIAAGLIGNGWNIRSIKQILKGLIKN